MREVLLYDPNRRPENWTDLMHPGQFAVLYSDAVTDVEKTAAGRYLQPGQQSTCLVFDSLAEAVEYCKAKVEAIPRMRCDIYDHAGKSKPPLQTFLHHAHEESPKQRVYWGWALVACSVGYFVMEWYRGFAKGLYLLIGINMLFAGLRLAIWGAGKPAKGQAAGE